MTLVCTAPDATLGVAQRLTLLLDCQARALGENGFQALAGEGFGTAALGALLAIFVAVIGYRLVLGHVPDVRDGAGWALRIGFVIALVTSWPTFQTLVYRVAADGPTSLTATLLSSVTLGGDSDGYRVQVAYDQLRVGQGLAEGSAQAAGSEPAATTPLVEPRPKTATLLVVATTGLVGALKLAIGFLLALSPFAFLALLFEATIGLFNGWLRGLAGAALASVGASLVGAFHLLVLEGELERQRLLVLAGSQTVDGQGPSTIVVLFALAAAIVTIAGLWMASAIRLPFRSAASAGVEARWGGRERAEGMDLRRPSLRHASEPVVMADTPTRAVVVARALSANVRREHLAAAGQVTDEVRHVGTVSGAARGADAAPGQGSEPQRLGVAGRRGIGRRTLSAARRDKVA